MPLWLIIAVRVIANPCSNALQKLLAGRGVTPLLVIGFTHAGLSLLVLPWLLLHAWPTSSVFWTNILISAALATVANVLIVYAVHRSDLSLVGPINSFKPVVSLLPGIVLLGEIPSRAGLLGIALVVAGSCLLSQRSAAGTRPSFWRLFADRGIQMRIGALVPSAIEAVFLKRALAVATPTDAFAWWAFLCLPAVVLTLFLTGGWKGFTRQCDHLRQAALTAAGLVLTTGLMQLCTLLTLAKMQVGYSLALFQTSTILAVLLGKTLFQEAHFRRRLVGSIIMSAGAAVIVVFS